jgi:hypothetical protein
MASFREQVQLNQQIADEAKVLTQQRLSKVSEKANDKYRTSSRTSYQSMLSERLVEKAATLPPREVQRTPSKPPPQTLHLDVLDRMAGLNMDVVSNAKKLKERRTSSAVGQKAAQQGEARGMGVGAEARDNIAETSRLNREVFLDESHQGLTAANEQNRRRDKQREETEVRLAREARERLVSGSQAEIAEIAAQAQGLQKQKVRMEALDWRATRRMEVEQSKQAMQATERLKKQRELHANREERSANRAEVGKYL